MTPPTKTMRDAFIGKLCDRMVEDKRLFFLTADFGAPKLDKLREDFKDRFINVGIAEQNLINIATGIALEGFTVYAYAIAPFITMRPYEQIRNNLSLLAQTKEVNINLIGVGAGLSYDVSGPSHHCLEDIIVMRALPHISVFSPSDWVLVERFVDYSINVKGPKYLRFDSKPLPQIYDESSDFDLKKGFYELSKGKDVCLVSTGFMTHTALSAVRELANEAVEVGLIDVFLFEPNEEMFFEAIKGYKTVITLEEAFINRGGLDSLVSLILECRDSNARVKRMGFKDRYVFELGGRLHLHKLNGLDKEAVIKKIKEAL
ncbi:MAG: transketolase [Nitrospirae bacterium]|nr:transketolase [Nitrospirota bacterium]